MAIAVGTGLARRITELHFALPRVLINEMVEARNENQLSIYIKQFRKIDLLIIDELGYVTFDLTAAELLFQLLATRYETMSTIIT